MGDIQRILVAVDLRTGSKNLVDYALRFARGFDAMVDVLHVQRSPIQATLDWVPWAGDDALAAEDDAERARRNLRLLIGDLDPDDRKRVESRLAVGDEAQTILDIAADNSYDLVVLGARPKSTLAHVFGGSVHEQVIRHAPCPVVVVRKPGLMRHPMPDAVREPSTAAAD